MARTTTKKRSRKDSQVDDAFRRRRSTERAEDSEDHVYGNGSVCDTEDRGHPTPRGRSPLELVVDASEGFIPLWAAGTTLVWRFRERSLSHFADPGAAKKRIRTLLGEALLAWGPAAPVRFSERPDLTDFEIVCKHADDCDSGGCVLASAFFPDAGRHTLDLYPQMFEQSVREQVKTMVHELGHIFGLRHFFAQISERRWASEVFGKHKPFSIMNYGSKSILTAADKADLKRLYKLVWNGDLTEINGTPVKLVKPFSASSRASAA